MGNFHNVSLRKTASVSVVVALHTTKNITVVKKVFTFQSTSKFYVPDLAGLILGVGFISELHITL